MRKSSKLIVVLLLCVIILSTQFTACTVSQEKKTAQDPTKTSSIALSSEETQKVHKISLLGPDRRYDHYPNEEWEEYTTWKELNNLMKKYNLELKYEFVPKEQYDVVIQTRLASAADLPDIVNISPMDDASVISLGKQGVLLDLNPLMEKYSNGNIKKMWEKYFYIAPKITTTPEGNLYWFPNLASMLNEDETPALGTGFCPSIRKDWLEKFNITLPTNAQEFYDALKYFRENDANGNGQKDEIIIVNIDNFSNSIAQWFGLPDQVVNIDPKTGDAVSPWYQPAIKDYIIYMNKLVNEKIIDASLIGASGEVRDQKISQNKVSAINTYITATWNEPLIEQEEAEYQPFMPLPAVDGITPYFLREPAMSIFSKFGITKNCKDLEGAIAFFDMVHTEEYHDLCEWGIEGETYKVNPDGKKEYLTKGMTTQEQAEKGIALGRHLYGDTVFPRIRVCIWSREYFSDVPDYKVDIQMDVQKYDHYFYTFSNILLAMPSEQELEVQKKYETALKTYSDELITKLILGQKSLDDWDKYIKDLKELGLDEALEVYKARHERFLKF
jgi:putative aldouronate transport system substrate-binding protein